MHINCDSIRILKVCIELSEPNSDLPNLVVLVLVSTIENSLNDSDKNLKT